MAKNHHDVKVETAGGGKVLPEDGNFVANAEFHREGADLFLTSPDGRAVKVEGYFSQNPPPDITTKDGAKLSPEMVDAFLPPEHPGQYAASGQTATDASPAGKITQIQGDAVVVHADGTKTAAAIGMPVFAGDVIQTSAKGAVSLLFSDNTSFAISENARLSVDQYAYNAQDQSGSTFFSMLQGVFVYTSGLIGKHDPSAVNIETPVGSIGIRGTVVAGHIAGAGHESKITVVDGAIVVSNGAGSLVMNNGFQTASLSSSSKPPSDAGQISLASFSHAYSSVSSVANDTFSHLDAFAAHAAAAGSPPPASDGGNAGHAPADATHTTAPADGAHPAAPADSGAHGTSGDAAPATAPAPTSTATADAAGLSVTTSAAPPPSSTFGALPSASAPPPGTGTVSASATTSGGFSSAGTTGGAAGNTATSTVNAFSANTAGITPPPPPPPANTAGTTTAPLTPGVTFNFAPFYLHGTATTADDGLPTFMLGMGAGPIVIGQAVAMNMPADTVYTMTGNFNGNVLKYDLGTTGNTWDTVVVNSQPVFHFDTATHQLILDNPWAIMPDLNPGGFNFTVTAASASAGTTATQNFILQYSEPNITVAGASAHVQIGDATFANSNPSVSTVLADLGMDNPTPGVADFIIGRDGDDNIYGNGGPDTLLGGAGNDTFFVKDAGFHFIDGGAGYDILTLGDGSVPGAIFDLTALPQGAIRGIEALQLAKGTTSASTSVILDIKDVFDMTNDPSQAGGGNHQLEIFPSSTSGTLPGTVTIADLSGTGFRGAGGTLNATNSGSDTTITGAYNGTTVTLIIHHSDSVNGTTIATVT